MIRMAREMSVLMVIVLLAFLLVADSVLPNFGVWVGTHARLVISIGLGFLGGLLIAALAILSSRL